MATKNYTTKTASLRATKADVRNLDAKKLFVDGVNINDLIKNGQVNILDDRGTLANDELDIWSSNVSTDEDGNVIVREYPQKFEISITDMTATQLTTLQSAVKIQNNQVLGDNDEHLMFFKPNGLTDGSMMFTNTSLRSFSGDLSNLTEGTSMFEGCTSLTSFSGDLSSLVDGSYMFCWCENLTSFNSDLSSLINGDTMFAGCKLDASSLANIIHTINPNVGGHIIIGLGIDDTEEAIQSLAEAIWCKDWYEVIHEFENKNWNVIWQFNGAPTE